MVVNRLATDHRLRRGLLLIAAVFVGLGIGSLVPPDPVTLPAFGTVPGVLIGAGALAIGGGLYFGLRRLSDSKACGCVGPCSCDEGQTT